MAYGDALQRLRLACQGYRGNILLRMPITALLVIALVQAPTHSECVRPDSIVSDKQSSDGSPDAHAWARNKRATPRPWHTSKSSALIVAEGKLFDGGNLTGGDYAAGLAKMSLVLVWLAVLFYVVSLPDREKYDDEFVDFEKRTRLLAKASFNISKFTLCFREELLERRFQMIHADILSKRISMLCGAFLVYVPIWLFLSNNNDGTYIKNPALSKISQSQSAYVYMLAAMALILLSLVMLCFLMCSTTLKHNENLESLVMSWLIVVYFTRCAFFERWFVSKMHGEDPAEVFSSFGYDNTYTYFAILLVLYLSTFTPLRFCVLAPFVVGVPCIYGSLTIIYGSPEETEGKSFHKMGLSKYIHIKLLIALCSCVKLGVIVAFSLTTKYLNEYHQRARFLSMHQSFQMIEALQGTEDGETPVAQVRSALAKAFETLEQVRSNPGVSNLVGPQLDQVSNQVDLARQKLQNANKLFEVKAEDVVRGHNEDDAGGSLLDFVKQNMGDFFGGDEEQKENLPRKKATVHEEAVINHSVKVQSAAELAKDWGENWGFQALALARKTNDSALIFAGERALIDSGNAEVLGVPDNTIRAWVRGVHCRYLPNGYHNEAHAAQVAHFSYWFAIQTGWFEKADKIQKCSLLLAAIGHDVGHFGRTNLYCSKVAHPISVVWNDKSPLENMHAATCFALMQDEADLLECLDNQNKSRLRNNIIRFILATDIKEHHSSLAKLKGMMEDDKFLQPPVDDKEAKAKFEEEMIAAGETLVKTSDIAHCMLPWEQHLEWSYRVLVEFFLQGDEEKEKGYPVSPLCERKDCKIAGSQAFFIDHFGKGLLDVLLRFAKSGSPGEKNLKTCIDLGQSNKEYWKEEEKRFDPISLVMVVINKKFGESQKEVVYPYKFEESRLAPRVSTSENLAGLIEDHTRS